MYPFLEEANQRIRGSTVKTNRGGGERVTLECATEDWDLRGRAMRGKEASCFPPVEVGDNDDEIFSKPEVANDAGEFSVFRGGASTLKV